MKPQAAFHIVWAAVAAAAFAAGYLAVPSTVPPTDSGRSAIGNFSRTSTDLTSPTSPAASSSSDSGTTTAVATISPKQAREMAFRVVTDPASRVERMRQLFELLPSLTAENWREALDGFETALRSKGEPGAEAYSLLLEQIGAIGGAEAMEDALTPEKAAIRDRVITILKGWANADPKACLAWFETQSSEIQDKYVGHLVAGLSRTDPRLALEITFRPGKAYYTRGTVTAVVNNAVSVVGVSGLEEIFTTMRTRQEIAPAAKQMLFENLVSKKLAHAQRAAEPAMEVLKWFDFHVGREYLSNQDSLRIVTQAAKANPSATLSWLEMQTERLTAEQARGSYHGLARELQKQTPEKLNNWLAVNPAHPQRDNVMEAATGTLLSTGDLDGAARMAAGIGSQEVRARVGAVVARRIQKAAPKP